MDIAAVMDEIATAVATVIPRTTAYPPPSLQPPAAFIAYPTVEYDKTYGRGMDQIQLQIVAVESRITERGNRDLVLGWVDSTGGIKTAVDGATYTSADIVIVTEGAPDVVDIAGQEYQVYIFEVTATGSGTT